MIQEAGSREINPRTDESPIDSLILAGRLGALELENFDSPQIEECLMYFASLRAPELVSSLWEDFLSPILAAADIDAQMQLASLDEEIYDVESGLTKVKSEYDLSQITRARGEAIEKLYRTMVSYRAPQGSARIGFIPEDKFREYQRKIHRKILGIHGADSAKKIQTELHETEAYLESIAGEIEPQIVWNLCKPLYEPEDTETVWPSNLSVSSSSLSLHDKIRDLQKKRAGLVSQKSAILERMKRPQSL